MGEYDAETVAEVALGVEVGGDGVGGGGEACVEDAVESVGLDGVIGEGAAGDIPALFEEFEEVGLEEYSAGGCGACVGGIVECGDEFFLN